MLLEDHNDTKVAMDTFVVLPPLGIHLVRICKQWRVEAGT